jgi:hypothetical protein
MIFFIAVMVWVGGIFVTSDPRTRIDRSCLPVTFADSILVAVVQMIHEPYAMSTHQMMLSLEYGCKFTVWKTFYEVRESATRFEQPKDAQRSAPRTEEVPRRITPSEVKSEQMTEVKVAPQSLPEYGESK